MTLASLNGMNIPSAVLDPGARTQSFWRYFNDENSPFLTKITSIALAALVTFAVGYAIGSTLLTLSLISSVGILSTICLNQEKTILILKRQISSVQALDLFTLVRFQPLDLGNRESITGDIDFIAANELGTPKWGFDKYGRQFYAMQLVDDIHATSHVLTIYQKYITGDTWYVCGPDGFGRGPLTQEIKNKVIQIFQYLDPDYSLVGSNDLSDLSDFSGEIDDSDSDSESGYPVMELD